MPSTGNTLPQRISRWKIISAGLKPLLTDLPHLTDLHGQIEQIITQSEDLNVRTEALRAESQAVNATRASLARNGDDLRQRLGASLKTHFGFTSEKLIEFGFEPRRSRGKAKKPSPAPELHPPAAQAG